MKRTVSILLALVLGAAVVIGLLRIRDERTKAAKRNSEIVRALTKEDLQLVLKSQLLSDPEKAGLVRESPESRKAFLKGLKEYLSLAAVAREEGLAEDEASRLNLQLKENGLLSELYFSKLNRDRKEPFTISQQQINSVWTDDNERRFSSEIEALYAVQNAAAEDMESKLAVSNRPQGEGLEKVRKTWAKARIVSDMARADAEFMQDRATQLRLRVLEAGVLSAAYLAKYWKREIKATDQDIAAYLAEHPEWDLSKKRATAEMVLQRAKAGEDFARLAKEFSEDRPTKNKGGLYDSYEIGAGLWAEVEAAALSLQPGQIFDKLVETKDGYHIVQLVDKTVTKAENGTERTYVSVRHILLQRRFEDPAVTRAISTLPPPFKTPEEIAKRAVETAKRQRFVDAAVQRAKISLPDDIEAFDK
jgi:hypothetical protein